MKYFLRIFLVLIIAVGAVYGFYQYSNGDSKPAPDNITTATKAPATEKNADRVLLAEYDKEGFKLYKSGDIVILDHNGKEYEFENWSQYIDLEAPTIYYENFDEDDDKEIAVRAVSDVNSDGEYTYNIYFLNPRTDENGKEYYDVAVATRSIWSNLIDESLVVEVTQLKSCSKIGQFAMNYFETGISYNKDTGIMTKGHGGYFSVLQDGADYLTIEGWSKGNGIYSIDKDKKVNLDIDVNISYKNSSVIQKAGKIHMQVTLKDNGEFVTTQKSLVFNAYDEYKVSNPADIADENWSFVENNSNKNVSADNAAISWINHEITYDSSVTTQTVNYASAGTDLNAVQSITLTNNGVRLTSKKGCTFDESSAKSGDFSVIINAGKDNEYSIAYKASVTQNGKSQELTISFDKSYPQSEIETISINYGVK